VLVDAQAPGAIEGRHQRPVEEDQIHAARS
jgi:hypothetical protein